MPEAPLRNRPVLVATGLMLTLLPTLAPAQDPAATRPLDPRPEVEAAAEAQPEAFSDRPFTRIFHNLTRDLSRLPSRDTAILLAVGGSLSLAAHPGDRTATASLSRSPASDVILELGEVGGGTAVQVGGAVATYLVGRLSGRARVAHVGSDLIRAQILNAILTQGLKVVVGRRRPDDGTHSFPSGHASGTFANAAVLQRHFGWKAGIPAYAIGAYVAASRLQENRHYLSDVVFGAAIGIAAGRAVTVGHGPARFALAPLAVPGGAGVAFVRVSVATRR